MAPKKGLIRSQMAKLCFSPRAWEPMWLIILIKFCLVLGAFLSTWPTCSEVDQCYQREVWPAVKLEGAWKCISQQIHHLHRGCSEFAQHIMSPKSIHTHKRLLQGLFWIHRVCNEYMIQELNIKEPMKEMSLTLLDNYLVSTANQSRGAPLALEWAKEVLRVCQEL